MTISRPGLTCLTGQRSGRPPFLASLGRVFAADCLTR
jgi:hypothetical protein